MTQPSRYPSAPIRVAILIAALLGVAGSALAQTAAGGANHTVILKSDGMSDSPKCWPLFEMKLLN